MTTLTFTLNEWKAISRQIKEEYGEAFFAISWRVKRTLGFTVRNHAEYVTLTNPLSGKTIEGQWTKLTTIKLDFVDEPSMTFFRLRYL